MMLTDPTADRDGNTAFLFLTFSLTSVFILGSVLYTAHYVCVWVCVEMCVHR